MTMNWKWEAKVDDSREKQKLYEENNRAQIANKAKSVDDLRRIEREVGNQFSLQAMQRLAERAERDQQEAMREAYKRLMSDRMNYQLLPPGMFGIWGESELPKPQPPPPLPEEHIVSTVTGYRAWNVPLFVDELRSVAKQSKWKPYQRFEAQCEKGQCEGVSCNCGIYAFNKMELVQKEYTTQDRSKRYVYGECHLWGRVLECKDGYRAQFGYPKALINTGAIAKRMAEVFGIQLL